VLAVAWSEKLKDEEDRLSAAAAIEHARGHPVEARAALDQLIARIGSTAPFGIAEHYAWRGELDRAFEWLERAYAARDDSLEYIKVDASLKSLRGDPRYAVLLKKMNLPPE